jgi:hypothetical protein
MASRKRAADSKAAQSARFREAAKRAGGADAKEFERAFKKIVTKKKAKAKTVT